MFGAIRRVRAKGLIWEPESYFKNGLDHQGIPLGKRKEGPSQS